MPSHSLMSALSWLLKPSLDCDAALKLKRVIGGGSRRFAAAILLSSARCGYITRLPKLIPVSMWCLHPVKCNILHRCRGNNPKKH